MPVTRTIPKGDLRLVDGDLVILEGPLYVAQKIAARFRFFLGEWFLDKREGVPIYEHVLVKHPDLDVIRSLFRRVLLQTPGVTRVGRFVLQYDESARFLSFDFEAFGKNGEPIPIGPEFKKFIVNTGMR